MRSAGVAFVLSTIVAAILTPLVGKMAIKYGLLDQALGSRKIHGKPVPRIGGLAIMAGFYAPLIGMAVFQTGVGQLFYAELRSALALMFGGLVIVALGVYDDIRGADAIKKFTVQIALAVALYFLGYRVEQIATPFGRTIVLGYLALPFTVFWIVGVINAMNLIDGLDGLAGGVAFFAIGATFILAFTRGEPLMMLFMACLGGAVLGFLFFNFNPASIFMGDTGSMFLGFVLAASSIQTGSKSSTTVAILIPVIVLGLPIADTLLAITRRAVRGRPLFAADKDHIHHRLLALGLSQRGAVLVLYGACVLLAISALLITYSTSVQAGIILASLALCFVAGMRILGYLKIGSKGQLNERRKRNRHLRAAARRIGEQLVTAVRETELWERIRPFADDLAAEAIKLSLVRKGKDGVLVTQTFSSVEEPGGGLTASFELQDADQPSGTLELVWNDGRLEIDRDDEIAVEILCEHVATSWRRISAFAESSGEQPKPLTLIRS